jgi:large subunit ribosomal protein L21
MFAVVRTGGKQYRVHPGDKIVVEKLAGNAGDKVTLGDVLLAGDGGKLEPTDGLTVAAEIVAQAKADKVTVFKKRRRHNYRRKKGHRQQHTILRIVAIGDHKAEKPAKAAKPAAAPDAGPAKSDAAETKAVKAKAAAIKPATVNAQATENPAPSDQAQANPPAQSVDAPAKASKNKPADKPTAKTPSTKNAAPAKGGAKKTPKAK